MNLEKQTISKKLNLKCRQVPAFELLVPSIKVTSFGASLNQLCNSMFEVMRNDDGIGLAAPQVGYNLRLITLDSLAEHLTQKQCLVKAKTANEKKEQFYVLVNPELKYLSPEKVDLWNGESCLSVAGAKWGKIMRSKSMRLSYQTITGELVEEEIHGKLATVLQHEIDHLYGVLYPARMKESDRNGLMVDYLKRNRLGQAELVKFVQIMQENLGRYTNMLDSLEQDKVKTDSFAPESVEELTEFAQRLCMDQDSIASMVDAIASINSI